MRTLTIAKRSGGTRTVVVPDAERKAACRAIVGRLGRKAALKDRDSLMHGFVRGRSPVTMAEAHVDHRFTMSFDLADCFDHITQAKLQGKLTSEEIEVALVDGIARQGLPTSPACANLALADLDQAILKLLRKLGKQAVYTRYADDLVFSFDDPGLIPVLRQRIPETASRLGWPINPAKIRVQSAKAGRRMVCGIAVDQDGIYPSRDVRRRLRAARHQGNEAQARGLAEWASLKLPRRERTRRSGGQIAEDDWETLEALTKAWQLKKPAWVPETVTKAQAARDLGEGCVITNDPAYLLGISTITTGWRSCMAHPGGQYRKGVWIWYTLEGTSVAAYLDDRTEVYGGVERRRMRARALVHQLRDGRKMYDRLYPGGPDSEHLRKHLEAAGYCQRGKLPRADDSVQHPNWVVGHVATRAIRPYCDTLHGINAHTTEGKVLCLGI